MLAVSDLRKSYVDPAGEQVLALDVPALQLAAGEQVALRGRSGTGKTTLLNVIAGILRADSGDVVVDGTELGSLGESQRDRLRATKLGYIFQTFNLLQGFTALENVRLGLAFGGGRREPGHAREMLVRVGLGDRLNYFPRQLSTGQQQRVAVARALVNHPRLVLADEPTGNLDRAHAHAALELIREVCREQGAALLLVSHDEQVLAEFDTVLDLEQINRAAR